MKSNITLVGMPASGKSTIGVLLAKRLGYSFVDVDIVIQEKTGQLLKEIIAERGTEGFLKVEETVNAELETERSVIAPGGSVISACSRSTQTQTSSRPSGSRSPFSSSVWKVSQPSTLRRNSCS